MSEILVCDVCGRSETPPYAVGDSCHEMCGGHFVEWPVEPPKENFLRDQYKTMYEAGLAEGIRRCREAVQAVIDSWEYDAISTDGIFAAIDAVKGE